jgi:hypothetical protein
MSFDCPPFDPGHEHLFHLTADGMLDPVLFGVLTAAVEEESAEAYRAGFDDGVRTAMLRPDPAGAEAPADEIGLPDDSPALRTGGAAQL